jgi:hypothetical protein
MKSHANGMLDLVPRSGLAHIIAPIWSLLDRLIETPIAWLRSRAPALTSLGAAC